MAVKRVGIMTGGGDCPGLNAVIRAFVTVGLGHGWEVLGIEDAFMGLIDLDYRSPHGNRWLGRDDVREILTRGGTVLGTSNRADPFRFAAAGVEEDVSDRVMKNFEHLDLDALVSIGGDGSMRIAQRFCDLGMPIVGVPKTIDNDLAATDITFGFQTAVQIASDALDRIHDTAESHDRVMLVEVMGRDAGWIALEAGLAGGAHGILIPEIPYHAAAVARRVKERRQRGQPFSVIVVAEGAKPAGGTSSSTSAATGGMPRLHGAAHRVADELTALLDAELRVTVLGHVQRGGTPTAFDRILATRYGHHAAELVARQSFGQMVALRGGEIGSVAIREAVDRPKQVAPDSQLVTTAKSIGVVFGDDA